MSLFQNLLYSYNDREHVYLVRGNELYSATSIWKYNRPVNVSRVYEIEKTIETGTYVDNIIYIAELVNEDKSVSYVCYDGNHRREAHRNSPDFVLVNVLFNSSDEEIKNRFYVLNQSNPVPELYLENGDNQSLRDIVEDCVERIITRFPKNVSTSRRPQRPNFNRDHLIDELYDWIKEKSVVSMTGKNLFDRLMELNEVYASGKHLRLDKLSNGIIKRVDKTGCYLFLKDFKEDLQS